MSTPGLRSLLVSMDQAVVPIGLVMGAGIFRMWRPTTCYNAVSGLRLGEPTVYTSYEQSIRDAWATVVGRLEEEAHRVGAHGVLGTFVSQQWLADGFMLEVQLRGTAVRMDGEPPLGRPFLSTLTIESFLKLLIGGWVPCGIGWGISAVHVHGPDMSPLRTGAAWSNREMPVPTAAVLLSRSRLEAQTRSTLAACGAEGGVGMSLELERRPLGCGGVLIDGLMLGTGVVRYRPSLSTASVARDLRKEGRPS